MAPASENASLGAILRLCVGNLVRRTSSENVTRTLSAHNSPALRASPALRTMIESGACPTLEQIDAVKTEMSDFVLDDAPSAEFLADAKIYVKHLLELESRLTVQTQACTQPILDAMNARDNNRNEMCRAFCFQVLQNEHAMAKTKIMASNILAIHPNTTEPRTLDYLAESKRLIRNNIAKDPSIEVSDGVVQAIVQSVNGPEERIRPILRGRISDRVGEGNDFVPTADNKGRLWKTAAQKRRARLKVPNFRSLSRVWRQYRWRSTKCVLDFAKRLGCWIIYLLAYARSESVG